jgi:hypothetical protein
MDYITTLTTYILGSLLVCYGLTGLLMGLIGDHTHQQQFIRRLQDLASS